MLNPGKTNPAQAPAAPGENRNLGCHRVPTNPQHHPLCREQGWSSRRNSIVHKEKGKIRPRHPFPAGRDGGSHPAPPPQHRGQIQRLFTGSLLIPKRLPGCPGSSCSSPHARSSSFQAAAKGAASPAAATMQRLTGPAVKGNVGASARNIKISDKGAIVAREPLWPGSRSTSHGSVCPSLTNRPGATQHPWVREKRGKGRAQGPRSERAGASSPWVEAWE